MARHALAGAATSHGRAAEPLPAEALAALGLGSAAVTVCGPRALLVAARRASTAPPPLAPEPLIEALLALEQGRAATIGARRGGGAVRDAHARQRSGAPRLRRSVERFGRGTPTSVAVPGSRRRLDAHAAGVADEAALAAIADLVAIALGRGDAVPAA